MATTLSWQVLVLLTAVWCSTVHRTTAQLEFSMEDPSGVLTVGGPSLVSVPTRIGCRNVVRCMGNGTTLSWKRFTRREPLSSGGNRVISLDRTDPDMDGVFALVGHLILDPVMSRDSGRFTCTINSNVLTAQLTVQTEAAQVCVSHYNISDHVIGTELAILCPVESCVPNLTVEFRTESGRVLDSVLVEDTNDVVVQFNPEVTESLAGMYNCRVSGTFMSDFFEFIEYFNITGTPQPVPTTDTPRGPRPTTQGAANRLHTSSTISAVVVLLLALLLA